MDLPEGVSLTMREGGGERYYFLMNFNESAQTVNLPQGKKFRDLDTGETLGGALELPVYAVRILSPIE